MSLGADEIETILVELVMNKPPTLMTPEADAMRVQLKKEIDTIHAMGGEVEIPHEIPSVG